MINKKQTFTICATQTPSVHPTFAKIYTHITFSFMRACNIFILRVNENAWVGLTLYSIKQLGIQNWSILKFCIFRAPAIASVSFRSFATNRDKIKLHSFDSTGIHTASTGFLSVKIVYSKRGTRFVFCLCLKFYSFRTL